MSVAVEHQITKTCRALQAVQCEDAQQISQITTSLEEICDGLTSERYRQVLDSNVKVEELLLSCLLERIALANEQYKSYRPARIEGMKTMLKVATKILRNECALGGKTAQNILMEKEAHKIAYDIVQTEVELERDLFHMRFVLQLLGNFCVQNRETQSALWRELKEKRGYALFSSFAKDDDPQFDVCAMIIYNCILDNNVIFYEMADGGWVNFLLLILQRTQLKGDFISLVLFQFLGRNAEAMRMFLSHAKEQYDLIILVIDALCLVLGTDNVDFPNSGKELWVNLTFLVQWSLERIARGENSKGLLHLLETTLLSLRDICTYENFLNISPVDNSMHIFLRMLQQMPRLIGHSKSFQAEDGTSIAYSQPPMEIEYPVGFHEALVPQEDPYPGYRRDTVSVLANLSYRRGWVHKQVHESNAVLLLLEQCQYHDSNEMLREWGLFCIRNLCEGSSDIQDTISKLKVQQVIRDPALEKNGIQVDVNDKGKPSGISLRTRNDS